MKRIFFIYLSAYLLIACDPSPEDSGDRLIYATIENRLSEAVELEVVGYSNYCFALETPVDISLEKGSTLKPLIYSSKRSGMYSDSSEFDRACFNEQNFENYRICYDENSLTHYIDGLDNDCQPGELPLSFQVGE